MEWDKFHELVAEVVRDLQTARGNDKAAEKVIRRYIKAGERCVHSPTILWDYFAISSPGIPERAGYGGEDRERLDALFERLMAERYQK